jgi:hypothetical protein
MLLALNRVSESQFLPKLRTFALLKCESEEITEPLLDALPLRANSTEEGLAGLQAFRLIWPTYPPLTRSCIRSDELRLLVALSVELHVGTIDENCLFDQ